MPNLSAGRCHASVRCELVAATSGWQVTPPCSPGEKLYMPPRESAPAVARCSSLILTEPALFWGVMAAAPFTKTDLSAAAPTFVPKPGACIHASMLQISSSVLKLWTNGSVAAALVLWKLQSVTRWQRCDLKAPRNHVPASGWPRTASSAPQTPLCRWQAGAAPRFRPPGAQTPP